MLHPRGPWALTGPTVRAAAHSLKSVQADLDFLLFGPVRLVPQNLAATIISVLIELRPKGNQVQLLIH